MSIDLNDSSSKFINYNRMMIDPYGLDKDLAMLNVDTQLKKQKFTVGFFDSCSRSLKKLGKEVNDTIKQTF